MLPVVAITIGDQDFQRLKETAQQAGFSSVSEFILHVLERYLEELRTGQRQAVQAPPPVREPAPAAGPALSEEALRRELGTLLRRIQDTINPYTSKVDELSRRVSELYERIERIEGLLRTATAQRAAEEARPVERRRTAMDYLKQDGFVLQKELKWLKKPEAFFSKLRKEGAVVVEGLSGFIAIDKDFYGELVNALGKVDTPNVNEALSRLSPRLRRLFQVLVDEGFVIYDHNARAWKATI